MSADFVGEFSSIYNIDLSKREFLDDPKIVESFFETVLAANGKTVTVSIGPETMTVVGSGIEMETNLHRTLVAYSEKAATREDILQLLQMVGDAFLKNMLPTLDRTRIQLAFMNKAQVDELNSSMESKADGSPRADEDMPIFFRQFGDLYVSPIIDGDRRLPLTERMCRTLGIERNDLFEVGLESLRSHYLAGGFKVEQTSAGVYAVNSDSPPASGLFLLKEFWDDQSKKLGAKPVVRIIHGDILMFTASKPNGPLPIMRYQTPRGGVIKPISHETFRWEDDTFRIYQNAA